MGLAMLRGWLNFEDLSVFYIVDPFPSDELRTLEKEHSRVRVFPDIQAFYQECSTPDILVLAVKPQMMGDVLNQIKAQQQGAPAQCIVSIAAGTTISTFETAFEGIILPIIRVMPNTPAAIGKGVSVLCANDHVTSAMHVMAEKLLSVLGYVHSVDKEGLMDAVTALSGSGPAYIFYLAEVMAQAGAACGLPADLARDLARQTVTGAAALLEHEVNIEAQDLRKAVTSPGGTTQAALEVLMQDERMLTLFKDALGAATHRSKELS